MHYCNFRRIYIIIINKYYNYYLYFIQNTIYIVYYYTVKCHNGILKWKTACRTTVVHLLELHFIFKLNRWNP